MTPSASIPPTLPACLAAQARRIPDRRFLTLTTGAARSFGEIDAASRRLAGGLARLGVGRGDRVLLMLPTSPEFVEAWFAASRLGAIIVSVNTALVGDYLAHIFNDSGASVMVAHGAHVGAIAAVLPDCPGLRAIVEIEAAADAPIPANITRVAFAEAAAGGPKTADVPVEERDPGAILYTSGTTGRSKGVVMPHGQLRANPDVYIRALGLGEDDVLFTCLPLYHANALLLGVYGALILGAEVVLAPKFSASDWLRQVRKHRATATNLLGVMVEFLLKQPETAGDADNALRVATAAPVSPDLAPRFEARFGVKLIELYGSTEVNCPLYHPLDAPRRPGSCGKVVEDRFECRIVDPETDHEAPPGEAGELVVRPRRPWTSMLGYHNRPDATAEAWRNLWFHTGDLMRRDEDGYHYFVDRSRDAIRRRGENISSFEVEEALASHPAVAEVAVVGIASPFESHEQEVKACVVLHAGVECAPEELAAHCVGSMPDFARPRFIEIMTGLPRTPTEKVRKAELRARGITPQTWVSPDADGRRRDERSNDARG
ncbi:ATP-dependent acyl-CoA ligase [Pikeienuella piscinae]|uniref:ATP-dependent acyl-CoA ligase n=1 Tax=Pikeienuella piscinae TaxID=2748098 RepID=A0A7L5C0T3_9RHOB|nr:AMP-binding protein [Pikeienuella piscinae]QIE56708.1 ATP-dependent acyl-CoA ligase [Pikeienuella piscinae]